VLLLVVLLVLVLLVLRWVVAVSPHS